MPVRIQPTYTKSNLRIIGANIGDSLSKNPTLNLREYEFWPAVLTDQLRAQGVPISMRNFARAGNTSGPYSGSAVNADVISRLASMTRNEVPDIAFVWIGVNDPGNGISGLATSTVQASPAPTKTVFKVATGLGASYHVGEAVTVGAFGVIGGTTRRQKGIITGIATDTLTVSGLGYAPAVGDIVRQGTQANIEYIGQQLILAGVRYLVIGNTQYLNYTGGTGDNAGASTFYAPYATLRPFQQAAYSALVGAYSSDVVAFCDIFTFQKNIITNTPAGNNVVVFNGVSYTIAQSDAQFHVAGTNQHQSALGEYTIAQAMQATIQAQSGWVTALQRG